MKTLEKGFYYNFKHDPGKGVTNFAYFILPYRAGETENPDKPYGAYLRLYSSPHIWIRPIEMFFEDVSKRPDNPTGQKERFKKIMSEEMIKVLTEVLKKMYPEINPFPEQRGR